MNASLKSIVLSIEGMVRRGQRDQAFAKTKDALRYYPRDARLWYWLARCVDNAAHATDALRRALQFDPSFEEARTFLLWIQTGGEPSQWIPDSEIVEPSATPPPPAQWALLSELGDDDEDEEELPPAPSRPAAPAPTDYAFLEEMESQLPPSTLGSNPLTPSVSVTEESLWERSYAFIGLPQADTIATEPPRGRFSFTDAPPSPAQGIPVRNSLTPLSTEQVATMIAEDVKPIPSKRVTPPPPKKATRRASTPQSASLLRLLWVLGIFLIIGTLGWALLRFDATPAPIRALHPVVGTQVAEAHLRLAVAPTPFPVSNWMVDATTNRYDNRVSQAETLLREGIAADPSLLAAQFLLSDILREQPGRADEAVAVAEAAAANVQSLDARAYAAEALVWAIAAQPNPDLALAQSTAEQAAFDVPASPHAQWARAMYAALTSNAGEATSAASLAATLDSGMLPAVATARQAEIHQRLNHTEEAIQLYERALNEINYVPWRVQVITLLRQIGRDAEVAPHLEALRAIEPDHPLLDVPVLSE